ncbi:hypothetical protein AGOR_G00194230 [Albula goreensis]|uniref:Uncharacterized protein n=1 Tax=Albula goreensis TaxID=1534307 RepID=A0A8T3CWW9_9TELE|nr:hypothetical protein AGOR_G00194230 [Albula goreensis]
MRSTKFRHSAKGCRYINTQCDITGNPAQWQTASLRNFQNLLTRLQVIGQLSLVQHATQRSSSGKRLFFSGPPSVSDSEVLQTRATL